MHPISSEAKNALLYALKEVYERTPFSGKIEETWAGWFIDAISIVESFPTSEPENHWNKDASLSWISVTDRFPTEKESSDLFLVFKGTGVGTEVSMLFYDDEHWFHSVRPYDGTYVSYHALVTHWQPLPKPPVT